MAGIFDLLKMLAGGQGASPDAAGPLSGDFGSTPPTAQATPQPLSNDIGAPPPGAAPAVGGVSAALASPMPAPAQTAPMPAGPPQPSTPPSTDQGLGGFLSRMVSKATARDPSTGMSFMDKLGDVGATMTDTTGYTQGAGAQGQAEAASRVAQNRRAQLMQMAKSLNMSPREQIIFQADPEAWTKANATSLETANVPGGDSRVNGATGTVTTAPKVGVENGEGYSATPSKVTDTGSLAVSPQQQLEAKVKQAQEAAMAAYHQAMVGVAQQNANANTTRANKPPALGNGGSWRGRVIGQGSVQ